MSSYYQCVVCGTRHDDVEPAPKCGVCLSEIPSVDDVPIRVAHAAAKLRATLDSQRRYAQNLSHARGQWEPLRSSAISARRQQAERAIAAHSALLALSNDIGATMEHSLVGLSPQHHFDDVLSLDGSNAWDIDHMLPYFYQDWNRSGHFPAMRERIRAAVDQHGNGATKLLVVGAGACGLVRDLAAGGSEVHALDLSVPCLVLASRLMRGGTIEVTIPHKFERDWRDATLSGAAPFEKPPHLSVANAARLPIQRSSFPIVVTQYLIDIATNPTRIVEEIGRVLELGGLWVNVGLPFGLTDEPLELSPLCDDALGPVLQGLGFELISLERICYRLSDTGSLFEWPETTTQWPQFSVARRRREVRDGGPDMFQQFRAGTSDAVWSCRPRRLPGRLLRGGPGSMAVSDASAAVVRWIGINADGRTPLSKLRASPPEIVPRLTEIELIEIVRHLCDEGMLALE